MTEPLQYYILEGKTPVPADHDTWFRWFASADKRVAFASLPGGEVSTIFLGLDHNPPLASGLPPLLFETVVFGGPHNRHRECCSTWDEAEAQHARAVALVAKGRETKT